MYLSKELQFNYTIREISIGVRVAVALLPFSTRLIAYWLVGRRIGHVLDDRRSTARAAIGHCTTQPPAVDAVHAPLHGARLQAASDDATAGSPVRVAGAVRYAQRAHVRDLWVPRAADLDQWRAVQRAPPQEVPQAREECRRIIVSGSSSGSSIPVARAPSTVAPQLYLH